jgi:Protein of unknown function (DUF3833)
MSSRRSAFMTIAALGMSLFGLSSQAHAEPLRLEQFFKGNLVAEGRFRNSWTGAERGLTVQMKGTFDGKVLRLKEDFVYSDGEKDQKTWVFTKTGVGTWSGLREDVREPAALITAPDGSIQFGYTARIGGYDLAFRDRLEKIDAKTVRNTASVYVFGFIKVGEVELVMRRK